MAEIKLTAQERTEFGKGAARRIRRAAKIPAVLYSHGSTPQHVTLPGHETMLALKNPNALLAVSIGSSTQLALPKDVQRDPIKGFIEHVDLVVVKRGEKVDVEVPVHVVGEAAPETVVTVEHQTVLLQAEATNIPGSVEVSVEGAQAGTQVLAGSLTLPSGTVLVTDAEALVVNVSAAATAEQVEAELAESESEMGIEHQPPAAEAEAPAPSA
jgi:large subunit ribosomal protein L25